MKSSCPKPNQTLLAASLAERPLGALGGARAAGGAESLGFQGYMAEGGLALHGTINQLG